MALIVNVGTNQCGEDEVYIHRIDREIPKATIMDAIETLYGEEGVTFISLQSVEE